MRIVIIGAGLVGTQLAKYLIQEKHDVSLIEANEERARHASNRLDCLVIHDEGNSLHALEEAGIAKADALVCVTDSDELNMIICGLAASRYPGLLKIARVRNDDYVRLSRHVEAPVESAGADAGKSAGADADAGKSAGAGADAAGRGPGVLGIDHFIHPDVEASRSIINAIERGALGDILSFANTPYELAAIDVAPGSALDGMALKDYRREVNGESLVTLLERKGKLLLPSGATVIGRGDRIHILARGEDLPGIFKFAGSDEKPIRRIGLVGGGKVGALIAEGILSPAGEKPKRNFLFPLLKTLIPRSSRRVVIIEQDYRLCKELAARFPEALIMNEDISDETFANEEQIDDLDLLITTTNNQELNIITAVYLKSRGVARTIAIVTGSGYAAMARRLGVDVVIPMQSVVVDSILACLMGGGVKGLHRLGDGSVDIIEIEIRSGAPVLDTPLTEFKLSAGALVMLVSREDGSFIPRGDYVFHLGDHIVLIARTGSEAEIEKLFGSGP
jgi:trk system potassium uptake protein TrkA